MADVIYGNFGMRKPSKPGWAKYDAQEPEDPGQPDVETPPDDDGSFGDHVRDVPDGVGAPPFTGEDLEDVGPHPHRYDYEMNGRRSTVTD
jgi:hypothetical protein